MNITKINSWIKEREHEVILVSLCLIAISFSLLNPLWYSEAPASEASLFAIFGKMWSTGEVLYQDMIDYATPGIYLINLLGYSIGGYLGIAFIETIVLVFGVISVDLAMRVFKLSPLSRFCSISIVIYLLGLRYYYGNMTEDYTVYLAMISSYPFALLFSGRKYNFSLAVITSLIFAITLTICPGNISYMLAWYTMLFLFYSANGRLIDSFKLLGTLLTCIAIVLSLFAYYFYSKGEWDLLNKVYFYSLSKYFYGEYTANSSVLQGMVGFFRTGYFIVLIGFLIVFYRKDNLLLCDEGQASNNKLWFTVYLSLGAIFTIFTNSVSGHFYDHYDQLFLPFMFIPFAFLMHRYLHVKQDIHVSFLTIIFLLVYLVSERVIFGEWIHHEQAVSTVYLHCFVNLLMATIVCLTLIFIRKRVGRYHHSHNFFLALSICISIMLAFYAIYLGPRIGEPRDELAKSIVNTIVDNTEKTERIWVALTNDASSAQYYVWTDRLPATAFLITEEEYSLDTPVKIVNGLNFFKPKFLIIPQNSKLKNHKYDESDDSVVNSFFTNQEKLLLSYIKEKYVQIIPDLFVLRTSYKDLNTTAIERYKEYLHNIANEEKMAEIEAIEKSEKVEDSSNSTSSEDLTKNDEQSNVIIDSSVVTEEASGVIDILNMEHHNESQVNGNEAKSENNLENQSKSQDSEVMQSVSNDLNNSQSENVPHIKIEEK